MKTKILIVWLLMSIPAFAGGICKDSCYPCGFRSVSIKKCGTCTPKMAGSISNSSLSSSLLSPVGLFLPLFISQLDNGKGIKEHWIPKIPDIIGKPDNPGRPENPGNPWKPDKPNKPDKPCKPDNPVNIVPEPSSLIIFLAVLFTSTIVIFSGRK